MIFSQNTCSPGDPSGPPGGGVSPPGIGWPLPVLNSYDPNDIVPPEAVGAAGWVRRDVVLPFMIRCENHPDSATAPVQEAWIYLPFHVNTDKNLFRLGDIGFGDFYIPVPTGVQAFTTTVNAAASLGVKVLVEAGIDNGQNRAFWHFLSLDPLTNLPTMDPLAGFLPVNDNVTHRGEAFAQFTLQPKASTQTWDILQTQASIMFDGNTPIATPVIINTIDATAPVSQVAPQFTSPDSAHVRVMWSGTDNGQSGLKNFTLFVADNGGSYTPWLVETDTTAGLLPATGGHTYRILCIARDSVGNVESKTTFDREFTFYRWFPDTDADGYGQAGVDATVAGTAPSGYVASHSDCNDTITAINPAATEICNGLDDDCDGLTDSADPSVAGDSLAQAAVKVFLQGPYVSSIQLMQDSLRVKNLIPLTEPYTSLTNFTHLGGGGEQTTASVLAVTGPNSIVDWVFLELRNAVNPSHVLATRSALLQRDGDVVDVDGISPVTFGIPAGPSYFLAVRHRNHLGVQGGEAVLYPECEAMQTDYRGTPPEGFYSYNGLNPAEKTISGTFVLWAGNGRIDFQIKYNGSNNDRTAVLAVVGLTTPNAVITGYNLADYNLDGVVKYNGSANDRNVLLGNVGIATPSAVVVDQVAR